MARWIPSPPSMHNIFAHHRHNLHGPMTKCARCTASVRCLQRLSPLSFACLSLRLRGPGCRPVTASVPHTTQLKLAWTCYAAAASIDLTRYAAAIDCSLSMPLLDADVYLHVIVCMALPCRVVVVYLFLGDTNNPSSYLYTLISSLI